MLVETLTSFFMWCTIINAAIFVTWSVLLMTMPDLIYKKHSALFPISRQTYDATIYGFLGICKIFFVTFSLVPYLALLIIGK